MKQIIVLIFIIIGFASCNKDPLPAIETIPVEESKSMTTVEIQNSIVVDSCALLVLKPGIDKKLYQLDRKTKLIIRELSTTTSKSSSILGGDLLLVVLLSFLLGIILVAGISNY